MPGLYTVLQGDCDIALTAKMLTRARFAGDVVVWCAQNQTPGNTVFLQLQEWSLYLYVDKRTLANMHIHLTFYGL